MGHVFYRSPAKAYPTAVRAQGVFITDSQGKRYLDGSAGALVVNLGHGRREIAQAMAQQAEKLAFAHGSQFTTEPQEELATMLARLAPGDLSRVILVSGGSEANETAFKMARQYFLETGRPSKYKIIARWTSYHGATLGALSASGHVGRRRPYAPLLLDIRHIPPAYCYRCPFGASYPQCGLRCAQALEEAILQEGPEQVAAFIAEPIVGAAGGAITPPVGYYEAIREICTRHQVLFIADEVMNGLGRTGANFAIDHWGVVPDLLTCGKGIGGGYAPLGAVMAREGIHEAFLRGSGRFVHGFTYSGGAVACAVGVAALRILAAEGLVERAREMGAYLWERLREADLGSCVGDIRGKGLMVGLEFVADKDTKEPYLRQVNFADLVGQQAFAAGLIVYPGAGAADGVRGDHILLGPPLIIKEAEIDLLVDILSQAIRRAEESASRRLAEAALHG